MTVLLVEDQDIKRYSVARWLKHNGIEVREAGSGAEALERAREPVDCVLLDVDLPDMDGYRVCRKLREASLNTTVIHYTASCCDPLAEQESIRAGADAFIPQPIEPEQLLYDIRNYVQLRYLQNEVRPV
jgi:CheY-like chemotaxis protein